MNQYPSHKIDDFECTGPRPPVPGEESRRQKMTESYIPDKPHHPPHIQNHPSPPPHIKWAHKLSNLLEDADGAELFKRYVEIECEACDSNRLKFYFACEGLKQQTDSDKVKQLIGAIYRKFLKRSQPGSELHVPESLRNFIKAGLKDELILTSDIFDQMQHDVARIISETTYPNFLQSDLYLQFVQNTQQNVVISGSVQTSSSLGSSSSPSELISHSSALPTLHEDSELETADSIEQLYGAIGPGISSSASNTNNPVVTLTRDALIATQRRRLEMRPPGSTGFSVYTAYASYNPVSRRDSELASLSSGRTESDTMSMSSISTDGRSHTQPQRRHHRHHQTSMEKRMMRENAITNEEANNFAIIPRTQRYTQQPLSQEEFAKQLMSKLELVQRDQENKELLSKKLQEADNPEKAKSNISNKSLADAIREKLQIDDDNDQDILDQHVSRVWSDLTPSRSPGRISPCPPRLNRGAFSAGISAQSSMRHSKSMPESCQPMAPPPPLPASRNKLVNNKWPSVNTDSGISLFSTDTLTKYKDQSGSSSRPLSRTTTCDGSSSSSSLIMKAASDDLRRSKRYPLPPGQMAPPPLPPQAPSLVPPPIPAKPQSQEFTVVVYSFCDEEVPYRIKIPGSQPPTLKQFKDYLPKKGTYRYFFKTRCDDLDNPVIQEEINNDTETLPLFEGKVMGTVKPSE